MAKVIIYLRVSSAEQTVENQLPALEKWIDALGHKLAEVYAEAESAWRSGHQRELAKLFADLARRKADICLVWALDQLSREICKPGATGEVWQINVDQIMANFFCFEIVCRINAQTIDQLFSSAQDQSLY